MHLLETSQASPQLSRDFALPKIFSSTALDTHDLWLRISGGSQDKMFTTGKNEPSRAHVSAHRIPLTNQLAGYSLLFNTFTQPSAVIHVKHVQSNKIKSVFIFESYQTCHLFPSLVLFCFFLYCGTTN